MSCVILKAVADSRPDVAAHAVLFQLAHHCETRIPVLIVVYLDKVKLRCSRKGFPGMRRFPSVF